MSNPLKSFSSRHFSLQALADGVFATIAEDGGSAICNAGIISLGNQTVVFDTFLTPQAAQDLLHAALHLTGREPEVVINSHYHNDHIWGNQVFSSRTQVISTSQTRKLIQTEGKEELNWERENAAKKLEESRMQFEQADDEQQRQELSMWVGYYQGLVEALPRVRVRLPDITFDGSLALHGPSRSMNLIPYEGTHTPNDAVLHLPDDGILFTGDLLFVRCHPYLAGCDIPKLLDVLEAIGKLDANTYVPGHGPVGSRQDLDLMMGYASMCWDKARELVANGKTAAEEILAVKIPGKYASWKFSRFYQVNLQALCKRVGAGGS